MGSRAVMRRGIVSWCCLAKLITKSSFPKASRRNSMRSTLVGAKLQPRASLSVMAPTVSG